MVDSSVSSTNASNAPHRSSLPNSPVPNDDDDEPPCSGPNSVPHTTTVIFDEVPPDKNVIATSSNPDKSLPTRRTATVTSTLLTTAPAFVDKERGIADITPVNRLRILFTPTHELGPSPGYLASLKNALLHSPLNILLLFIPVSWAPRWTHQPDTVIFVVSALAIVPLAALLGLGTEQIALRTSQAVGGLLNASLGNVVELIIAGIALGRCDLDLVQSSLLGGLLSNLLLVLGMAFIVGGFRFRSQEFQPMAAQLNSSLMTVSVIALVIPAAFHEWLNGRIDSHLEVPYLLQLSRGTSVILILIYLAYLFFQFYSHNHLFIDVVPSYSSPSSSRSSRSSRSRSSSRSGFETVHEPIPPRLASADVLPITMQDVQRISSIETNTSGVSSDRIEYPRMNTPSALFLLVAVTVVTYLTAENLVVSVNGLVAHSSVNKQWITLIVIPIISNAAEHTTAVMVARKGKFDLAMSVAVGSCIQIALFVIPVLVIVAWGLGKPLTLFFDPLETLCLFLSVIMVKFAIEDGRTHWMSGTALVAVYILIAICFWYYPEPSNSVVGMVCT
ncbi:calcium/proton exchanger [Thelephora ganbajun]|uniref:Calcium/proton exchanger n=1 Tax=Thelephora ganbajun TaxID=370292 RepID=A0ACB6ZIA3_THEGA|nr:calcium/proton exchanger [Thelephora ganbajun]